MTTLTGDKADPKKLYVPHGVALALKNELEDLRRITQGEDPSLAKAASIVFSSPGIEYGFIQELCGVDRLLLTKDGGSKRPEGIRKRREFRCVLYSNGCLAEITDTSISAAISGCFEQLGLPVPVPFGKL